eukprot:Rmarinus@m.25252
MNLNYVAAFLISQLLLVSVDASGYGGPAHLRFRKDSDKIKAVEGVGMDPSGRIGINVLSVSGITDETRIGFVIERYDSENSPELVENFNDVANSCLLDKQDASVTRAVFTLAQGKNIFNGVRNSFGYPIPSGDGGYHVVYFANCKEEKLDLDADIVFYNIDPNTGTQYYLDAGLYPLPSVYGLMSVLFAISFILWMKFMADERPHVHKIHYFMTVLIFLKTISLALNAFWLDSVKNTGRDQGWDVAYYVFASLKGMLLFVVIILIGTGWTLFKPFLSSRDKQIIMFVLPLQVFVNVTMVVLDEKSSPGSESWDSVQAILSLIDIACCLAVFFPIVWSIKHLGQASSADGKAAKNLERLVRLRQFYVLVVGYMYFTRIVVALFGATLPYTYKWVPLFFSEVAAFVFYCLTGYKFRPREENPYIKLAQDDDDVDTLDAESGPRQRDGEGGSGGIELSKLQSD